MFKKLVLTAIGLAIVIGAIVYAKLGQFSAMGDAATKMVLPPETVTAMTVAVDYWEEVIRAPATVSAVQGVTVSAEVGGRVAKIAFESGAMVEAGALLLQLDASSEYAQLAAAEATATLAETDVARIRKLGKRDLASDDAVDRAEAQAKETVAQVGIIRAQIEKKSVKAPFTGRLGLRLVNLGEILSEGTPIVSLQTMDPVYLDFSVPQQQLGLLAEGMPVRAQTDAAPDELFNGRILAINPEVDAVTRSVRVRARVDNAEGLLRPGMFARVEVVRPERRAVLPVVATAVLYAPFGDSVFVIEDHENAETGESEKILRQQFVQLGESRGDFVDVTEGLEADETVVTSGVFKLRTGMRVVVDNTLAPEPKLDPRPDDS